MSSDQLPRPGRRLLWRGLIGGIAGLGLLMASSFAMPDNPIGRNDLATWLPILGLFGGMGLAAVGAVLFVIGLVKRLREPRPPRDPTIKRPTAWQATAIIFASMLLGVSTCGVFATQIESNGDFAGALALGGAGGFVLAGVVFFYGLFVLVRRWRGR